ncbi:MAG TPA: hypothetical protein VMX11_07290 [Actinomycetes bacterium]|nr:hypothetical protein [Actinomycetes bacterium]
MGSDAQQSALIDTAVDLGTTGPDSTFGNGGLDVLAADHSLLDSPDFSLTATGVPAEVGALHGFSGPVRLSRSGLPKAVTTSWSQKQVTAPGSSIRRVKTSGETPSAPRPSH